jgi:VCBS repeat-containing protein
MISAYANMSLTAIILVSTACGEQAPPKVPEVEARSSVGDAEATAVETVALPNIFSIEEDAPLEGQFLVEADPAKALQFEVIKIPLNGAVTILDPSKPYFRYVANSDFNGQDNFTFQVTDGSVVSSSTIAIEILPVNDLPVASAQDVKTDKNASIAVQLSAKDIDSKNLSYLIVDSPLKGSLAIVNQSAGTYRYTPHQNAVGKDQFSFKASDGTGESAAAKVSVTISQINSAPVANNSNITIGEDNNAQGSLTATDIDGDSLTYSIVANGTKGTAEFVDAASGEFIYRPSANVSGSDFFTFKVSDGRLDSAIARVNIVINPVNDAPNSSPGTLTLSEDSGATNGTLVASDIDSPALTYAFVTLPLKGTLSLVNAGTGAYSYTPNLNANGSDSFTFKASDSSLSSDVVTVSIAISPVNDAPVALPGSLVTDNKTAVTANLSSSDVDSSNLTYSIVTNPSKGAVTILNAATGQYRFTPTALAVGSDSFTFKVNDGSLDSNAATISVALTGVNDAPIASAQSLSVVEDTAKTGQVNATDVDSPSISYVVATQPVNGTLEAFNATTGTFTYRPKLNFFGSDSFSFKAYDGQAYSDAAVVSIAVSAVNDLPTSQSIVLVVAEDGVASGQLIGSDIESTNILFVKVSDPANGSISNFSGTAGTFEYRPNANYNGSDSFTFRVSDGTSVSVTSSVTIIVNSVNDAPTVAASSITVIEDLAYVGQMSGSDVDSPSITFSLLVSPNKGIVSISNAATGAYTYTPFPNSNGADGFSFRVSDGSAFSGSAAVSISITPVNDAPTANAATFTLNEDSSISGFLSGADVDGGVPTFSLLSFPSLGTAVLNPNGSFTYQPLSNKNGVDSFTFRLLDSSGASSAPAVVTLNITPINDIPVVTNVSLKTSRGDAVNGKFVGSDVDNDPLTYAIATQPAKGAVTITNASTGEFIYLPNAGSVGSDFFTFRANDSKSDSASGQAVVQIVNLVSTEYASIPQNQLNYNDLPSNQVSAIKLDGGKIYVGTPLGLAISLDDGATFKTLTTANGLAANQINNIHVAGKLLYVATTDGLSLSSDGGETFVNKSTRDGSLPGAPVGAYSILDVSANSSGVICAISSSSLVVSRNSGATFQSVAMPIVSNALTVFCEGSKIYVGGFGGLAVSTDDGQTFSLKTTANGLASNAVYKVISNGNFVYASTFGGLSISTDSGNTFVNKNASNTAPMALSLNNDKVYAYGSTNGITMSSDASGTSFTNIAYTTGPTQNLRAIGVSGSIIAVGTLHSGLFISTNGGANFTNRFSTSHLSASVNDVYVDPDNRVFAATSVGLFVSSDNAKSFSSVKNAGLDAMYVFTVKGAGSNVYVGTSSGFFVSSDKGQSFTIKTTANGLANNSVSSIAISGSTIYLGTFGGGISISTNNGQSFVNKTVLNGLGHNSVSGIVVSGSNVYSATHNGLSISNDGGETFVNRTTANGLISNVLTGVMVSGNYVYATSGSGLGYSTDGGATFVNKVLTTSTVNSDKNVRSAFAKSGKVYVGTSDGLFVSSDDGATFIRKSHVDGVPAKTINSISDGPGALIYLGTIAGIGRTTVP